MDIKDNIKALRIKYKLTQTELGKIAGVSDKAVSTWEKGNALPRMGALQKISDHFGIPKSKIIEGNIGIEYPDNVYPVSIKEYPLIGEISCGKPIFASQDRGSYVLAGTDINADFCLRAKGDSMIGARILDGDIVFIHEQPEVENGEIAAVIIDDEATLKRVYYQKDMISLVAENPAYQPMIYKKDELNSIRILGLAVAFQSDVI